MSRTPMTLTEIYKRYEMETNPLDKQILATAYRNLHGVKNVGYDDKESLSFLINTIRAIDATHKSYYREVANVLRDYKKERPRRDSIFNRTKKVEIPESCKNTAENKNQQIYILVSKRLAPCLVDIMMRAEAYKCSTDYATVNVGFCKEVFKYKLRDNTSGKMIQGEIDLDRKNAIQQCIKVGVNSNLDVFIKAYELAIHIAYELYCREQGNDVSSTFESDVFWKIPAILGLIGEEPW